MRGGEGFPGSGIVLLGTALAQALGGAAGEFTEQEQEMQP
jgi:hypothetical protein